MPELPEVETVVRELDVLIVGKIIKDVFLDSKKTLKISLKKFKANVVGKKIKAVNRRAKLIIVELVNSDYYIVVHLKMTGQLIFKNETHKHTRLKFVFKDGSVLAFRDLRKFGYIDLINKKNLEKILSRYGPEPLTASFTPKKLIFILEGKTAPIKSLLLKQDLIAGIGNIYADEVLHLARINPKASPKSLNKKDFSRLHQAITTILKKAVKAGGSSSKDYFRTDGSPGSFQNKHQVYGREGKACFNCQKNIKRIKIAGRSSHFCPQCQK